MLTSVERLLVPETMRWEMVIVDNGSTDDTPAVVEKFKESLPIKRVFEPNPGLSNARNAGVAAAQGDYILWTDDDVEVEPGWLNAYVTAFERFPDAAVFGGRIIPRLEPPTPAWFEANLEMLSGILAVRNLGEEYLPLSRTGDRIPFGANYAIRSREQKKFLYDPRLGVAPGRRLLGEEVAVMEDILASGSSSYWVPDSKVFHIISPARQTEEYVRDYYVGGGQTVAFYALIKHRRNRVRFVISEGIRASANIILYYGGKTFMPSRWWLRRLIAVGWHSGAFNYAIKYRPE
jgi:glycosyltransferase involved in cell wall biosynthesis